MSLPRILVAGDRSGVGKTTFTVGLIAALRRRGLAVQPFKVGPDFIDPLFHRLASGRAGRNLDGWMLPRETNLEIFAEATADADVAVLEGVMGLFDGKDGRSLSGTSAEAAIWLDAAVVLVVDASAVAASVAAVAHGFDTLVPELRVAAVVTNRVAGEGHYRYAADAIAARCRPEPIGYLPRDPELTKPERHLGLHLPDEAEDAAWVARAAEAVERHVDLDRLLELADRPRPARPTERRQREPRARIGVARDAAFCFYYESNLALLGDLGAELVEFSPVTDDAPPPELDGLYLGGGYPELHAEALSGNASMRSAIAEKIAADVPVYAECGGFMYLTQAIVDVHGVEHPMVGAFPTRARMRSKLARLGYVEVTTEKGAGWAPAGLAARGHEFRYSEIDAMPKSVKRVYEGPSEGYRVNSTLASYAHLHFLSCAEFAEAFVARCADRPV